MMEVVRVLTGEYKGFHGILEGYINDKAKITIPIGEQDVKIDLKIGDFEIKHL